ncbi:MAG: carboxypeptidase regulatory-like domain-containing protein [Planctomycetes bacterium]|nr:carboxypeptidase regulatory-like domain-containing protein [Planctomycetota bacterium]
MRPGTWRLHIAAVGYLPQDHDLTIGGDTQQIHQTYRLRRDPSFILFRFQAPNGVRLSEVLTPAQMIETSFALRIVPSESRLSTGAEIGELFGESMVLQKCVALNGEVRDRNGMLAPEGVDGFIQSSSARPYYLASAIDDSILECKEVLADTRIIDFTVDPTSFEKSDCTLRVRTVEGPDRVPRMRARVALRRVSLIPSGVVAGAGTTAADGQAEIRGLRPGKYDLSIRCDGYAATHLPVTLVAGQITDIGEIVLSRGVRVEGVVRGADGSRVSARVRISALAELQNIGSGSLFGEPAAHGAEGRFQFLSVVPGDYSLVAYPNGGRLAVTARRIRVGTEDIKDLVMEVSAGAEFTLECRKPNPTAVCAIVRNAEGCVIGKFYMARDTLFTRGVLEPGTYSLDVYTDAATVQSRSFVLGSSPVNIEVP